MRLKALGIIMLPVMSVSSCNCVYFWRSGLVSTVEGYNLQVVPSYIPSRQLLLTFWHFCCGLYMYVS